MTQQILDLIARLEKATGPDRELDRDIWLAVTPGATWRSTHIKHAHSPAEWDVEEARINGGKLQVIPNFTSSIDAALTLVPEGALWEVRFVVNVNGAGKRPRDEPQYCFRAGVGIGEVPAEWFYGKDFATPAIALCIAALKARLAVGETG